MSEPRHLDLVDRLRGQYHLPVNDGAGPLNGSMTFSREFPAPPIQKEAADELERLRTILSASVGRLMNVKIDLATGKSKAQVAYGIEGCIKAIEAVLGEQS